jgi:hypothetical protein
VQSTERLILHHRYLIFLLGQILFFFPRDLAFGQSLRNARQCHDSCLGNRSHGAFIAPEHIDRPQRHLHWHFEQLGNYGIAVRMSSRENDLYRRRIAELAPMIDRKPDFTKLKEIHLEELARRFRMQKIVFETASEVYDLMAPTWKGSRESLLAQLVRLVERYIESGRVVVDPPLFNDDDKRRRIVITLNMTKIVQHIWEAIRLRTL